MHTGKEIESFNLADLDIQELEQRLEAAGIVHPDGWLCGVDGCGIDCPQLTCGLNSGGGGGGGGGGCIAPELVEGPSPC